MVTNNDIENACYHCEDRHFKCHQECPKYKEFKKALAKAKKTEGLVRKWNFSRWN